MSGKINLRRNKVDIRFLKKHHSRKKGEVITEEKRLASYFVKQGLAEYVEVDKKTSTKPKRKTNKKD